MTLECSVQQTIMSGQSSFDIAVHWFQRDINGNIIDHGTPSTTLTAISTTLMPGYQVILQTVRFGDQWFNQPPRDTHSGEFWCQVIINNATQSAPVYLGVSNSIVIENYTFYGSIPLCADVIFENDIKCADTDPAPVPSTSRLSTVAALAGSCSTTLSVPLHTIISTGTSSIHITTTTIRSPSKSATMVSISIIHQPLHCSRHIHVYHTYPSRSRIDAPDSNTYIA